MSSESIEDVYDLGPLQDSILVHSLCYPALGLFVRQTVVPLATAIDVSLLRAAWLHLTAETPTLRTAFIWEQTERPVQVVHAAVTLPYRDVDLVGMPAELAPVECERLAAEEWAQGFDLGNAPLFRILAIRTSHRVRMVWTYHHILLDAWSVGLLLEALWRHYRALASGDLPPRGQLRPYRDFIAVTKRYSLAAAKAHWQRELEGFGAATPLTRRSETRQEAAAPGVANSELVLDLTDGWRQRLASAAGYIGVPTYTLLEGAWALTLSARSGATDVVFGAAVSGRTTAPSELESVVGLLSNVLPHRVRLEPDVRVTDWLRRLRATSAAQCEYQHVPLGKIRAWRAIPGGGPLFLTTLVHETTPPELFGFIQPEADARSRDHEWSGDPLTVFLAPSQGFIWFVYDSTAIADDEARTIARLYDRVIPELLAARDDTVAELRRRLELAASYPSGDGATIRVSPRAGWVSSLTVDARLPFRNVDWRPSPRESMWIERQLEACWLRALGRSRIGWDDNVFDLGADSLLVLRLHTELERGLGIEFPLLALFSYPTINGLARVLRTGSEHSATPVEPLPAPHIGDSKPMKPYLPIAVVGMHVNAPGAANVDEFWEIVREGREVISYFSDEELEMAGVPRALRADPRFVPAGAPLPDIDRFDAAFFGVNPSDAASMDPQIRRFLEGSWSVLESAGYDPGRLDVPVGVYAGSAISTYLLTNLLSSTAHREMLARAGLFMQLNERDALPTYVSYKLNLKGPSVAVQTMCSTSLVAVHLACQALRTGECDMALAGGASINVHQSKGYLHEEGLYFSPDGHTRPFDAKASGTIFGSGLGIVLLKRLEDAVRDGDEISAVIIGSALNNDGSEKAGFTAPNVAGQARAISEALAVAGVDAESIGYVEAHGTGTPLGDLIELEALTRVFRRQSRKQAYCCLGSAKANFGHLDKAAGVVGLIKACLAIRYGELPPTANFQTPSPLLDWSASPFYVRKDAAEWPVDGRPRRAGVSSFGIGGTNAHVVLEQAPVREAPRSTRAVQLLTWSARTPGALKTMTFALAATLEEEDPARSLADIAYVGHVGRSAFAHRRILVAETPKDAARWMRTRDPERIRASVVTAPHDPDVIFMFPGGGVQSLGMARDTFAAEPLFRQHIERADAIAKASVGVDLIDLLVSPLDDRGDAVTAIDDVLTLQVALFSVEYALARLLMHWGIRPVAMVGHSVGEYVAACIADVFTFEEALHLLITRGRLMRELPASGMLVVFRPEDEVRGMLSADLHLTAVNSREQCVVSGSVSAIEALNSRLIASDVECQPLKVGIASHSPMMQPMVAPFFAAVSTLTLRPPSIPLVSCVTGRWMGDEDAVRPRYWIDHLTRTVRFADAMMTVTDDTSAVLVEVGPGQALANLARNMLAPSQHDRVISCMGRTSGIGGDLSAVLEGLGRIWLSGVRVDWRAFHQHERPRRVSLPTYPFERESYWVDGDARAERAATGDRGPASRRHDLSDWFYLPSWRRTLPPLASARHDAADRARPSVLLIAECLDELISLLIGHISATGHPVVVASRGDEFARSDATSYQVRGASAEDYAAVLADLERRNLAPGRIVHCVSPRMPHATDADSFERSQVNGLYDLSALVRAVAGRPELARAEIIVVSSKADTIDANDEVRPERAVLQGVTRVVPQEYPTLRCRSVEIDERSVSLATKQLATEILSGALESVVAYRGTHRWTRSFEPIRLEAPAREDAPWRDGGVYLITGGLGRIGVAMAEHIVKHADATIVLVGRSVPDDGVWSSRYQQDAKSPGDTFERLHRLRSGGAQLHMMRGDVADPGRMLTIVQHARRKFGGLHGVVHAAGALNATGFATLREPGQAAFREQFLAKVHGLYALEHALENVQELEFCLLLSSLSAHLGGLGHVAYAAANRFMDAFARRRATVSGPRWISVSSELWHFGEPPAERPARQPGLGASLEGLSMSLAEATATIDRILARGGLAEIATSTCELNTRYRQWAVGEASTVDAIVDVAESHTMYERSKSFADYVAPRGAVEQQLAGVWAEVLGFDQVGVEDDFFRLGGHSISAIRIVARLRGTLNVEMSVADLLTNPTIARLSSVIAERTKRLAEA